MNKKIQPYTYSTEIRCPHCMHKGKFRMTTLMDTHEDPDAAKKIMSGDCFSFTCSHCNAVQFLSYTCLYHDGSRKLLIGCADTQKDFERMVQQMNGEKTETKLDLAVSEWMKDCTSRITAGPAEFQESVLIHELGLDDRIIQIAKVLLLDEAGIDDPDAYFNTDGENYVITAYSDNQEINLSFDMKEYDMLVSAYHEQLEEVLVCSQSWAREFLEKHA